MALNDTTSAALRDLDRLKFDFHAERLQVPGEAGMLAPDIRIGNGHAEARLFTQCGDVQVLIPHNDSNRIGGG
jgi:hypothetical protein